jgi:hypothetical protein
MVTARSLAFRGALHTDQKGDFRRPPAGAAVTRAARRSPASLPQMRVPLAGGTQETLLSEGGPVLLP